MCIFDAILNDVGGVLSLPAQRILECACVRNARIRIADCCREWCYAHKSAWGVLGVSEESPREYSKLRK